MAPICRLEWLPFVCDTRNLPYWYLSYLLHLIYTLTFQHLPRTARGEWLSSHPTSTKTHVISSQKPLSMYPRQVEELEFGSLPARCGWAKGRRGRCSLPKLWGFSNKRGKGVLRIHKPQWTHFLWQIIHTLIQSSFFGWHWLSSWVQICTSLTKTSC